MPRIPPDTIGTIIPACRSSAMTYHTKSYHILAALYQTIPYISTAIPADILMISSTLYIVCNLDSTAIDNGLVGSGQDRATRHVRPLSMHIFICAHIFLCLNVHIVPLQGALQLLQD